MFRITVIVLSYTETENKAIFREKKIVWKLEGHSSIHQPKREKMVVKVSVKWSNSLRERKYITMK